MTNVYITTKPTFIQQSSENIYLQVKNLDITRSLIAYRIETAPVTMLFMNDEPKMELLLNILRGGSYRIVSYTPANDRIILSSAFKQLNLLQFPLLSPKNWTDVQGISMQISTLLPSIQKPKSCILKNTSFMFQTHNEANRLDKAEATNKLNVLQNFLVSKVPSSLLSNPYTQAGYAITQTINDTGISIDKVLVKKANAFIQEYTKEYGTNTNEYKRNSIIINKYLTLNKILEHSTRLYGLFQFMGASTGRWTSHGINFMNLPKALKSVNEARNCLLNNEYHSFKENCSDILDTLSGLLRTVFIPKSGYKFIDLDFKSIEMRILQILTASTTNIGPAIDPYILTAHQVLGQNDSRQWTRESLRSFGKELTISCQYGAGANALLDNGFAERYDIPQEAATIYVNRWRKLNTPIVNLWNRAQQAAIKALNNKIAIKLNSLIFSSYNDYLIIKLPSGRCLYYKNCKLNQQEYLNYSTTDGCRKYLYGSRIIQHITQAIGADLLTNAMFNVHKLLKHDNAGSIVGLLHDELLMEVKPEITKEQLMEAMTKPPVWLPNITLEVKGYESQYYK